MRPATIGFSRDESEREEAPVRVDARVSGWSRDRKAITSAGGAIGARALFLIISLASLPLLLGYLGVERYGAYVALTSLTSMLVFSDFGLGNGLMNRLSEALAHGDREIARRLVSSAFFVLVTIAVVLLLAFVLIYPLVPWAQALGVSAATAEIGPVAAVLFGLFVLGLPLGIAERTRMAFQEGYLNSIAVAAGAVAGFIGLLVALSLNASFPLLVFAITAPPLGALAINASLLFFRQRPWLRPSRAIGDRKTARQLARIGFLFFILQLAVAVAYQSDTVVAAAVISAEAATTYAVTLRVFMLVPSLIGLFLVALWPAYTEALARGDLGWVWRTLRLSVVAAAGLSAISSLVLFFASGWIIGLLTGEEVHPPALLVIGAAVWAVIQATFNAITMLMNAASIVRFQVIAASAMAISSVSLSILFAHLFGLSGIVWGTVVAYIVCSAVPVAIYLPRMMRQLETLGAGRDSL
jgi:O-antigen/teichoic acid export membrane protein